MLFREEQSVRVPGTSSESLNKAKLVPSPLLTLLKLLLFLFLLYYGVPELIPDLGSPAWEMGILGNRGTRRGPGRCKRDKEHHPPTWGSLRPSLEREAQEKRGERQPQQAGLPEGHT